MLALPLPAAAECAPAFVNGDVSVAITGVSIEDGGYVTGTAQLRLKNAADDPDANCSAVMRVSRVGAAIQPDFPSYILRAPGNSNIEILPEGAIGGSPRANIPVGHLATNGSGQAVSLQFRVPTEWGIAAGNFAEQLMFSLYDVTGARRDQSVVHVTIAIPAAVSVRLAGAVRDNAGAARIDLGVLSPRKENRSSPFAARILSTTAYSVSFLSANGGRLRSDAGRSEIPYKLYFDGRLATLAGSPVFSRPTHTGASGDVKPMLIVVPPTTADAGRYSDRLTMMVSAI